jgi:hypothetical protein
MRGGIVHHRNNRSDTRGFVIAPILYLLGMIGVMAGVLFSGYSQILRSGMTVQNNTIVKSDLQAAANMLSAQSVFSGDGMTLCPPRSIHQTGGNPCNAAPVSLIQFGDYVGNQLPANYAYAGTTGSPTEVGVFAAGSGVKVLDAYGHTYIYCRWENPRSNPAAPAFVLLSAGPNGKLETRCGDSSAQGDDGYLAMSVGAAINRAALWQANGSSNVTYGAIGTQVVIDNSGDITAAGNLNVSGNTALAGTLGVTGSTTLGALSSSGNITSSANITGNNLTATGSVNGASGSFSNLFGSSLNISGTVTVIGTSILGNLSAGASTLNSLAVTGNASMNNGLSVQGGDIVLANGYGYAQIDNKGVVRHLLALDASNDIVIGSSTGNILFYAGNAEAGWFDTSGDFTAFGTVNGQNGSFGNLSAGATTLNGTLTGTSATFSSTVIGTSGTFTTLNSTNLTTINATVTGTLTANNFTLSGTATAGTGNFTNLNVTNLTASNNITAGGTVSGTNITATGAVSGVTGSFGSLGATSLTVTGNELIGGNLQVLGVSSLNSTGIGLGSATPVNILDIGANGGIHIAAGTPSNTSYALYNVGGALYWNGMPVGTSGGSGSGGVNAGTQYQMAYYAANGSALSGDSAILTDSSNDLLVKSGKIGIGSSSPVNLLDIGPNGGIHINTGTPSNTSYALYNVGGSLYWNGSAIGNGGGSGTVTSGSAGQVAYYPNNGTTVVGTSTIEIVGGNVGIGVTNPKQSLDVYSGGMFVRGPRVIPTSGAGLVLDYSGMGGTGVAGIEAYDYGAGNPLNLTLQPFGGNIGIGTAHPDSLFEIFEPPSLPGPDDLRMSFGFNPSVDTYNMGIATNLPTGRSFLLASEQGTYMQALMFSDVSSTENIFAISSSSDAGSTWQPAFVVNQNGKIGIGSTVPVNTLDVTGTGIHIASGTPSGTTYQLYNSGGTLYWNGSAVGGTVSGTANYIPVFTSSTAIGNSVMYQSSSKIGIGSTSPVNLLDIGPNGGIHINTGTPTNTNFALYNVGGSLYWNGSAVGSGGSSNGTGSTGYDAVWTSATTIGTGLLYESAGYVGIGTAIPNATLEIYDNGDGIILSMAGFQQGATQYYDTDAYSYIDADTAGTGGLFLEGLSNSRTESGINMDGTVADTVLDPGQPAIKLSGEKRSGTGLTSLANNELILDVENFWNGPLFDVNGAGYVGIGTSAPQVTLDVNGVMRLAAQTAAPLTCNSTIKGTIAMTAHNGLCFCNGSAWQKIESPTTACAW